MAEKSLPPCDLVMKGGITSGIVYPPVIVKLKDSYTFRSIGGTSAGAIGAAGAAAAEYNRAGGGFVTLEKVGKSLGEHATLLNLFQAPAQTHILLDILLAILQHRQECLLGHKKPSLLHSVRVVSEYLNALWNERLPAYNRAGNSGRWIGVGVGIITALILTCACIGLSALFHPFVWTRDGTLPGCIAIVLFSLCSLLGGYSGQWIGRSLYLLDVGVQLYKTGLYETFYGICPGHTAVADSQNDNTNLTDWLSIAIDTIAGLPTMRVPLTFGALQQKEINLQMVTSNLNHSQPYILPDDLSNFIFKESDMQRLFPAYVVEQLKTSPAHPLFPVQLLPEGYHFLPDAADLPVVFGVRLSLSFPLLLSAVPLYTLSSVAYQAYLRKELHGPFDPERHLQCNWFSDGGICSNFPIQFFDNWLPQHPTFGINMSSTKMDASVLQPAPLHSDRVSVANQCYQKDLSLPYTMATNHEGKDVYLPLAEGAMAVEWSPVESIPKFLRAIFQTTQNYRDTLQMRLPSYRERVVQIRLTDHEGGLSLTMPSAIIQRIEQKGEHAGALLQRFQFDQHWWVRFLVLMARLEDNLYEMREVCDDSDLQHRDDSDALNSESTCPSTFRARLQREWRSGCDPQQRYPYYRDQAWCEEALIRVQALKVVIAAWQETDNRDNSDNCSDVTEQAGIVRFFQNEAPMPTTVLRVTPRV